MRAWFVAGLLIPTSIARAADVGEIALVPDVGGQIHDAVVLPTSRYLERGAGARSRAIRR